MMPGAAAGYPHAAMQPKPAGSSWTEHKADNGTPYYYNRYEEEEEE